ncbi:phosphatase PAP2 family protein [Flavobacterium sp. RHBU_3]|uniref:phosphatase PAP2 family protein n=1 Tax=Flavobacterium sp. RHBU_3 TaxID=3391184 RepID=UPI0039849E76
MKIDKNFITYTVLLVSALLSPLYAQVTTDSTEVAVAEIVADTVAEAPENGSFGHRFAYDMGSIYHSILFTATGPARWEKKDFITAGAFIGGSALLLMADEDVARYFREQGERVPEGWHKAGWYMGKPQYNYTFSLGVFAAGLITKNEKIRRTSVLILSAATTAGVMQTVLKKAVGRARPGMDEGNLSFDPFSKQQGYHSFPSGHTILSTTVVYAISKEFSNPWAKAGILSIGLITPMSRMWDNAHWLTDVVVGAGLSIICVESADHYLKLNKRYEQDRLADPHHKKISWNFQAGYNTIGITGTF